VHSATRASSPSLPSTTGISSASGQGPRIDHGSRQAHSRGDPAQPVARHAVRLAGLLRD
jgi:hypothetical protein